MTRCTTFAGFDLDRRNKTVRDRKLCLNCLSEGHGCKSCPSKYSCRTCSGRHHTLIHRDRETSTTTPAPSAPLQSNQLQSTSRGAASLFTALVAFECGGRTVLARALLDSGAAIPMMTESLANSLGLPRRHDPTPISGIVGATRCQYTVTCNIMSVDHRFKMPELTFTLIPSLDPIARPSNVKEILDTPALRHFALTDAELGGRVDLVLGVTQVTILSTGKMFQVGNLGALPTQLGLCLSCLLDDDARPAVNTVVTTIADTEADISRLWELDRVPDAPTLTPEEQSALDQFDASCARVDGRYSVSLPRATSPPDLGDSRRQALSRLFSNEKSLSTRNNLQPFLDVVRKYITLDHAEVVPPQDLHLPSYYLPVHAVIKSSSTSTKVRAVFDASARTTTGASLNDQLLPGPNVYPPLPDVLIRFRCHSSAVSADISKMFREILLNPEERNWHRFLLRATDNSIKDARMKRLTFGVKSSPFLATQVLRRHAQSHLDSHPAAARSVLSDFYVDDLLSGAPTTELALSLFKEIRELCSAAGMDLRKWRTNDPALRKLIPEHLLETDNCSITPAAPKALGVH